MDKLNTILVDIDPTVVRDYVVERAKLLGLHSNACVELFINNYELTGNEKNILENLRNELVKLKISVNIDIRSEQDLTKAIIDKVDEVKPDLVLKSTHGHDSLKYKFITNTDWKLIQKCPAPLLLVKPSAWHFNGGIVASVDPLHIKAEQTNLDHQLVAWAEYFEEEFNQIPKIFHCYYPVSDAMQPKRNEPKSEVRKIKKIHNQKIYQLLSSHNIDPKNVEIVRGDLITELISYIKSASVNVLVIGALSRTGLEKFIVGSTAEKILDTAPCDILIIKPQLTD